jgi:hypothetical protein
MHQVAAGTTTEYVVYDGLLFHSPQDVHAQPRLCVPVGQARVQLLQEAHDGSAHLGRDRTVEKLKRHFHWRGLHTDVAEYVRTCPTCQVNKPANQAQSAPCHPCPSLSTVVTHGATT